MPPLTVLTDDDVHKLLHGLTTEDILQLQTTLGAALHQYSSSTAEVDATQPERTSVASPDGSTTLFMPATSPDAMGVKVVTVAQSATPPDEPSRGSLDRQISDLSLSAHTIGDTDRLLQRVSSISTPPTTAPRGTLTLLDPSGVPTALVNATELTAFRTALASTLLLRTRANVHDVTIFGAGKQAYWHARLTLLLRPGDVHHLNLVNRSFDRAAGLLRALFRDPEGQPFVPGAAQAPKVSILTPRHAEYARRLEATVRASSVIYTTTAAASAAPVFPAAALTDPEARTKGRYIAAVGSYKPAMLEVPVEVVRDAVGPQVQRRRHLHRHRERGGAIVVDTLAGCMREAGELIQAGVTEAQVVEVGELIMLLKDAERRREEREERERHGGGEGSESRRSSLSFKLGWGKHEKEDHEDGGLSEWLSKGNVIYKSVGLGLMDIVVGHELVKMAQERGIGTTIENF